MWSLLQAFFGDKRDLKMQCVVNSIFKPFTVPANWLINDENSRSRQHGRRPRFCQTAQSLSFFDFRRYEGMLADKVGNEFWLDVAGMKLPRFIVITPVG